MKGVKGVKVQRCEKKIVGSDPFVSPAIQTQKSLSLPLGRGGEILPKVFMSPSIFECP